MKNLAGQKEGEAKLAWRGRLRWAVLSLVALLLLAVAAPAGATETGEEVASAAQTAPCMGLKPYDNLEELLYQFFINLDSDCLFEMPVEELERTWDTEILSYDKRDDSAVKILARRGYNIEKLRKAISAIKTSDISDDDFALTPNMFEMKLYKSERDAFYIEAVKNDELHIESFVMKMTCDYAKKEGTLFIDGNYPKGFPVPFKMTSGMDYYCFHRGDCPRIRDGQYFDNDKYYYYWLNSGRTRMVLLRGEFGFVTEVDVYDKIPDFLLEKIR